MGYSKSSSQREVYSNTIPPQVTRKISNKQVKLKKLKKGKQTKPKVNKRKEIIKIRAEINETEMKKTIAKINETKRWYFDKINKMDEPFARLIKKKGVRIQIDKVRNEKEDVTTDTAEIQRIMTDY